MPDKKDTINIKAVQPSPRVEDIDPTFEPWEPPRPIPIFLLAVLFALAIAGVGIYLSDLAPRSGSGLSDTVAVGSVVPPPVAVVSTPAQNAPVLVHSGRGSVWSCASCHGDQGEGAGITPRLAGLPQGYLTKQLHDFASGDRLNESMHYVARELQQQDIAELAAYYASLPVPQLALTPSGADLARGQLLFEQGDWKLNVPSCASCHGGLGQGVGDAFPPLAAQQPEYLFRQLSAWKGDHRHNSPQSLMDDIAGRLSYEDLYAVSHYAASLSQGSKAAD